MSIYTPKIVIAQFSNSEKVKTENTNGEIKLMIEKNLTSQEIVHEEPSTSYDEKSE